jgi:hypothetical protein
VEITLPSNSNHFRYGTTVSFEERVLEEQRSAKAKSIEAIIDVIIKAQSRLAQLESFETDLLSIVAELRKCAGSGPVVCGSA